MDDIVEVTDMEDRPTGQYIMRMRAAKDTKRQQPSYTEKRKRKERSRSHSEEEEFYKLHVANLHYDTEACELKRHLEESFIIDDVRVIYGGRGGNRRSKGWAIVTMRKPKDAVSAIEWYHDSWLGGRQITVRKFTE